MTWVPPFEVGAVHETVAYPSPEVEETEAGAVGTVTGVFTASA